MNRLIIIIGTLLLVSTIRAQTVTGSRIELTSPSPKIVFNSESAGQTIDNDGTNNGWPGFLFNAYDQAGGPLVTKWSIVYSARDNYLYFNDYSHNRRAFELKDDGNMVFNPFGNVGIGTSSPATKLDILATAVTGGESLMRLKVSDASTDYLTIANNTGTPGQFIPSIRGFHNSDNRLALRLTAATSSNMDNGNDAAMIFDSRIIDGSSQTFISNRPIFQWANYSSAKMTMLANGSLGIGTITTGTHKLAVEGSIGAREIKVEASSWSDFVFENNYKLRTLEEVEQHIDENGHLPEIPSEAEVTENGINLGEMNAKLLQKIEELTLYLIEQNKENQEQRKLIEELQKEVSALKTE